DRDDPLRPQTMALAPEEWLELVQAWRRARAGYQAHFAPGRLRTMSLEADGDPGELPADAPPIGSVELHTSDRYGAHFRVSLDESFDAIVERADGLLRQRGTGNEGQRFEEGLRRLAAGQWGRFHPAIVALQDRFRATPEGLQAVAPCLAGLFGAAHPDPLAEALVSVVEREPPGPVREAAEGHLAALSWLSQPVVDRLCKCLPSAGDDLRAIGSLLRPLLVARAGHCVAHLCSWLPALCVQADASRRLESWSTIKMALELFTRCPEQWSSSRPAIELLCRRGVQDAVTAREALSAQIPVPWESGLEDALVAFVRNCPAPARNLPSVAGPPVGYRCSPPHRVEPPGGRFWQWS
ncbi:MAG: hypothetical protein AB1758_25945, partial [Candidatus Eremiobacterota bacterium]